MFVLFILGCLYWFGCPWRNNETHMVSAEIAGGGIEKYMGWECEYRGFHILECVNVCNVIHLLRCVACNIVLSAGMGGTRAMAGSIILI